MDLLIWTPQKQTLIRVSLTLYALNSLVSLEEKHAEMFHTNSYPADKNLNSGLVTMIKGSSLGAAGFEMYMLYQLVKHLY